MIIIIINGEVCLSCLTYYITTYILKKENQSITKLCKLRNHPQISLLVKTSPNVGKNLLERLMVKVHSKCHFHSIGVQVEKGHTLVEMAGGNGPERQVRKEV